MLHAMPPEFIGQAKQFLNEGPSRTDSVGVVGDMGLDCFVFGSVDRISPEAPVPVLFMEKTSEELGCAANVIRSLAVFCEKWPQESIQVFGLLGEDQTGDRLLSKFQSLGNVVNLQLLRVAGRPTTLKTRFIAGSQHQLLRVDSEDPSAYGVENENHLLEKIKLSLPTIRYLIIQDYSKGLFSQSFTQKLLELCQKANVKTLVDPHRRTPPEFFNGAWLMKPNIVEAEILIGRDLMRGENGDLVAEAAREIQQRYSIANVIVSRSRYGSTLLNESAEVFHFPAIARAVSDVTGAGDTYLAVLAASLSGGASLPVACVLANAAASVVVAKVGTAAATAKEMLQELSRQVDC